MALFRKARSAHYDSKRYGRFLVKALNRGTDFIGVVALRTAAGISTATADVIRHTTTRMQETFFSWRQDIPAYFLHYTDPHPASVDTDDIRTSPTPLEGELVLGGPFTYHHL